MDGKRMVEVRERERGRESIWDSGGVRGITARLSHFAVSPASLHQIESIFLVDFRSRSRPRYHGHEIFRGKSAIVQPWFFFSTYSFSLFLSISTSMKIFSLFFSSRYLFLHILKERHFSSKFTIYFIIYSFFFFFSFLLYSP